MSISWPEALPEDVLEAGYDEKLADLTVESPNDNGAPKVRRRFTAKFVPISFSMIMDYDQWAAFEVFYYETTGAGTQKFEWVHPIKKTPCMMRFRKPIPQVVPYNGGGENLRVSIAIWVVPS